MLGNYPSNTRTGDSNKIFSPQQAAVLQKFFIDSTYDRNWATSYHTPNESNVNDIHRIDLGHPIFSLNDHNQNVGSSLLGGTINGAGNAMVRSCVNGVKIGASWQFRGIASLDKSRLQESAEQAMCDVVVSGLTQTCNTGSVPIQLGDEIIARMPTPQEVANPMSIGRDHIDRNNGKLTLVFEPVGNFYGMNLTKRQLEGLSPINDARLEDIVASLQFPAIFTELRTGLDREQAIEDMFKAFNNMQTLIRQAYVIGRAEGSAQPGKDFQILLRF